MNDKYTEAALNLSKASEIAIESIKKFPPKKWDDWTFNHILSCYEERKNMINNPEPKFRKLRSLKYLEEDVFTRFQEGSGEDVEYFWKRLKEEELPYERENKMAKILNRKKINNDIEYDFVTDVIVPYQQEGLITEEEMILLGTYLSKFEEKHRNK